jgi:hypothetical protein
VSLRAWLERVSAAPAPASVRSGETTEAVETVNAAASTDSPVSPLPSGAEALLGLLREGAEPVLSHGRLYLRGEATPTALQLLRQHGHAVHRALNTPRAELAAPYARPSTWTRKGLEGERVTVTRTGDAPWPGTEDAPAQWPGSLDAFLLGVGRVRCVDCKRLDGKHCEHYGPMAETTRPVRCLWALPKGAT